MKISEGYQPPPRNNGVRLFLIILVSLITPALSRACPDCGGMGLRDPLSLRELEPKATALYPDAPVIDYVLEVTETTLAPAGKPVRALALNGTVPGPVLRFRVGDVARIRVTNRLANEETSTHWHGLLVPNLEDGVPHLTTPPILPGRSRTFEFLLKHPGTYWYHSHTGLQEQRGIYGAIVVDPAADTAPRDDLPRIDREEVLVLSDWTNENPDEVMRTLLRGSDWYAFRKGASQNLFDAWRSGHLRDFFQRERARLPAMDVSDVAYDAFLVNGRPSLRLAGAPGETIRVRIINAAASSYFYLSSSAGPLTLVAADGPDIRPIRQNLLLVGMAETYDLLVTIPASGSAELRATAQDGSGHASVVFGDQPTPAAPSPAALNLYNMDAAIEAVLDEHDADGAISDDEALADEADRPLPPYTRLQSPTPTALPADAPVRALTLKLTGDMLRYTWSIDDEALSPDNTIRVTRGEILRLTLVNNTMMHHPMHLHGHFFRLVMPGAADPAYSPLKHTVDVPPMSRRVIEFLADEERDWLFHCHLLYHHKTGMARVFSYDDQGADHKPDLGEHAREHPYVWVDGTLQSHLADGRATAQRGRDNLHLDWQLGWGRVHRREYEIDATYARYLDPRRTVFGGYRLTNRPGGADSVIVGATYLLPYNIDATATLQSDLNARLGLAKELPLTARLGLVLNVGYDTAQDLGWSVSINHLLTKNVSLVAGYDDDHGPGAGIAYRF